MKQKKREKFCPQCETVSENSAKYCSECGFNLDGFYASSEKICAAAQEYEHEQKYSEAAYLYRYGSICGHAACMYRLGVLFELGSGVKKSAEKALYCHSRAAEHAYLPSIQWLYRAYLGRNGQAEPDAEKARSFLLLAANMGDEEARADLARLFPQTLPEDYDAEDHEGAERDEADEEPFDLEHGMMEDMHGKILRRAFLTTRQLRDKNLIRQEEEAHLALLRKRMEEQIRQLEPRTKFTGDIKDVHDLEDLRIFQAEKELVMSRLEKLEFLKAHLDQPYFARMVLKVDGEQWDLYIGQDYFMLANDDELTVYSHNAPVPMHIYDRLPDFSFRGVDYSVLFKRRFDIHKGKLVEVFQSYLRDEGHSDIVYDKFLARILERKKDDKRLTDIIPTIQENQNQIITRPRTENLIVQGCAGCGKTMILLQRLEFLAFRENLDLRKVTVLVPSEEFKRHIAPVVRDLRLQQVKIRTIAEFYLDALALYADKETVAAFRSRIADRRNGDDAMDAYYYSNEFYETLAARVAEDREKWAQLVREFEEFNDCYLDGKRDFSNRSEWIRSVWCSRCSAAHLEPASLPYLRRKYCTQCQQAKSPLAFHFENISPPARPKLSLSRYGVRFRDGDAKKELFMSELYAEVLLNFLFGGAKKGQENEYEGNLICIDEGQDLDPNEYRLLRALCGSRAVFNIFGDIDQRLDPKRGVSDWNCLERIGTFSYYELNENYRNTQEVTTFINARLQKKIAPLGIDGAKVLSVKEGEIKRYLAFQSAGARVSVTVSGRDPSLTGRLAEDTAVGKYLHTVEQCKGLEFDAVFVFDGDMTYNERYISYSRALGSLYLVTEGT